MNMNIQELLINKSEYLEKRDNYMEKMVDILEEFLLSIPIKFDVNIDIDYNTSAQDDGTITLGYDLLENDLQSNTFYIDIHNKMNIPLDILSETYAILHELGHLLGFSIYATDLENVSVLYRRAVNPLQDLAELDFQASMSHYFYIITELDANIYANMFRLAYKEQIAILDSKMRNLISEFNAD